MNELKFSNIVKTKGLNCTTSTISEYKKQLINLHSHISKTDLSQIKCIKPNNYQMKDFFDFYEVQRQLDCSGILEAIKIRDEGQAYK